MSAPVGGVEGWEEKGGGRVRRREGWRAEVWMGAGTLEKTRCRDEKKTRPRKGLYRNVCSVRETKSRDKCCS